MIYLIYWVVCFWIWLYWKWLWICLFKVIKRCGGWGKVLFGIVYVILREVDEVVVGINCIEVSNFWNYCKKLKCGFFNVK